MCNDMQRIKHVWFLMAIFVSLSAGQVSKPHGSSSVVRLDAELDKVVSASARFNILKGDYFGIAEGPVWIPDNRLGYLVFSDIAANAIYKWTPGGVLSVIVDRAGYTGDLARLGYLGFISYNGRLNVNNSGPNGMIVDAQGRLIFCAQGDRAIIRIENDGKRTVLADRYAGKRLSRPNDLVMRSDGIIYFTDRRPANNPAMELPSPAVFMIKNGEVKLLITDDQGPNGIAFSPDEKYLYVTSGSTLVNRYEVLPDGNIVHGQRFIDMSSDKSVGIADGMKVDAAGNVYCMGPGGIWIISPEGKHLGNVLLPEMGTNMTFGDPDGKTLYVTDRRTLGRIRVKIPGAIRKSAK
jgi:gluconolactonase